MQEGARLRAAAALFDKSLLVDFSEQVQYDTSAAQLTPLVKEAGRLVVTDQRVYFQPLHNVTGGSPVLSHPLSAVAAVAHRTSSLRPIGNVSSTCDVGIFASGSPIKARVSSANPLRRPIPSSLSPPPPPPPPPAEVQAPYQTPSGSLVLPYLSL